MKPSGSRYIAILRHVAFYGATGVNISEILGWNLENILCGSIAMRKIIIG